MYTHEYYKIGNNEHPRVGFRVALDAMDLQNPNRLRPRPIAILAVEYSTNIIQRQVGL